MVFDVRLTFVRVLLLAGLWLVAPGGARAEYDSENRLVAVISPEDHWGHPLEAIDAQAVIRLLTDTTVVRVL